VCPSSGTCVAVRGCQAVRQAEPAWERDVGGAEAFAVRLAGMGPAGSQAGRLRGCRQTDRSVGGVKLYLRCGGQYRGDSKP
jgi:hypothetical protein